MGLRFKDQISLLLMLSTLTSEGHVVIYSRRTRIHSPMLIRLYPPPLPSTCTFFIGPVLKILQTLPEVMQGRHRQDCKRLERGNEQSGVQSLLCSRLSHMAPYHTPFVSFTNAPYTRPKCADKDSQGANLIAAQFDVRSIDEAIPLDFFRI